MDRLEKQLCPLCLNKTLTLTEDQIEIPYFGKVFMFGMNCGHCKYSMSDIEAEEAKEPGKQTIEVESEDDMKIRVVKSSNASVKIPQLKMSMEPGPNSVGFVSNIEGLLERFEKIIEAKRDAAEDPDVKKSAKNLLKKIRKVKYGDVKLKITIEDPSGNSAIISEKTKVEKLKK